MVFSDIVPLIAMCLYLVQAVVMIRDQQYGFAFMWLSYAMANLGIIFAQRTSS